jgi:hypothetical protein
MPTKKETNIAVECSYCEMNVNAKIIAQYTEGQQSEDWEDKKKYLFLECPSCSSVLLATRTLDLNYMGNAVEWTRPVRVWPEQDKAPDSALPKLVRRSIEEALKCYKAKAYLACAVMCRRALESVCLENGVKARNLAMGLKELLQKKVIDEKIYQWGEALRAHGNIGAHATKEEITITDAKDLLEFTTAICDYVFVLREKFEKFMKRNIKTPKDLSANN